jgi:hypothetical protein
MINPRATIPRKQMGCLPGRLHLGAGRLSTQVTFDHKAHATASRSARRIHDDLLPPS